MLSLELYAYLNYNLFSNNGHFSQMKSLFTNKLLMTAHPGSSFIFTWGSAGRKSALNLGFYTQIMIICCILERDKHEHKWMILHFKAQPFLLLYKKMLSLSMCHKLVGYKVQINVFMRSSMFPCLYLNKIFEHILILLQFLKASILYKCPWHQILQIYMDLCIHPLFVCACSNLCTGWI